MTLGTGALIAFLMAAINIPFVLTASPSAAWFNWLSMGLCAGLSLGQLIVMAVNRDR